MNIHNVSVENMSYNSVSDLRIQFFLSYDRHYSPNDFAIGNYWYWNEFPGEGFYVGDFDPLIPRNIPSGNYYVIIRVTINGFNEDDVQDNNSTCLSDPIIVENTTGTTEIEGAETLNIYPNPVINVLNIEYEQTKPIENRKVEIFDMTGQLLLEATCPENSTRIDFSRYCPGVYILRIDSGKGVVTRKFIKN